MLGFPIMAIALLRIASAQAKIEDRSAILDALVVGAAAALNLWLVIGDEYTSGSLHTPDEKLAVMMSLATSVLVVVLTVRLLFSLSTQVPSVVMLLGGLCALLMAGFLWASTALHGSPVRSTGIGLCFVAGYALMGLAACHESAGERVVVPGDETSELRPHRLILLIVAAIVPPALIIGESMGWFDGRDHGLPIAITAIVVSTLVFVRMFGLTVRVREFAERHGRDRFEAMVRHSQDIITVIDAHGTIEYASPAVTSQWGYTPEECVGWELRPLVGYADAEQARRHVEIAALLPPSRRHDFELRIGHRDGAMRDYEVVATNLSDSSDISGTVLTLHDITDRKSLEAQLAHQAFHDSLTGLANRALFLDRVEHALQRNERNGAEGVAVLFIDLDDFKSVNDGLGHGAGDDLLIAVGERLHQCLRPGDTAARLGGDEFAVLLDHPVNLESSQAVAQRILEVLQLPIPVGSLDITVPASIGIALAGPDATTEEIIRDADLAMYAAKGNGKGRAEESGLIIPIGRWIMEQAVRTAATWQQPGQPTIAVSVNVSGFQMRSDTGFGAFVGEMLTRYGLPGECLIIELTETVMMEDTNHTLRVLQQFRDLGVRISIDDFGTGFCSLSYLRRFAVDRVKIDRSFVEELGQLPTSMTLASNILTLARALGVGAIAEGVETPEQVEVLRSLSCESAQGFYIARPVSDVAIASLIARGRNPGAAPAADPSAVPASPAAIPQA